jgi:hypothetical protein
MKFILQSICFLLLSVTLHAQTAYTGKGKVNLKDGTTIEGDIQFKPAYSDDVEIKKIPTDPYTKYSAKQVKSFTIDSNTYEPKIAKGGEVRFSNKPVFMEAVANVTTGLNMYIEHFQEKVKYTMNIPLKGSEIMTFYVSIPGNTEEVFDLNATRFIPKFDDKVSKFVADCPALAQKIQNKEKGYFYNLMNQQKAPDIWATIVLEYAKCK